jgi:two-component system, NarL family, nitrate/nitrite response regulator NarL
MTKVGIVDDHPVVRIGLSHVLGQWPGVTVAVTGASVAGLGDLSLLDVLLLDLYLDEGRSAITEIGLAAQSTSVLVLSASADPGDVLAAIRVGAIGYLTKDSSPELLAASVLTAAAGGFVLSWELADIVQTAALPGSGASVADGQQGIVAAVGLSRREEETLSYIARGFTHDQIATRLGISKSTVNTYVERIRDKLQAGNKADLTRAALARSRAPGQGRVRDAAGRPAR